jgi:hypothetical protein
MATPAATNALISPLCSPVRCALSPSYATLNQPLRADESPEESREERNFHQTLVRLTTPRQSGDIVPISEKGGFKFPIRFMKKAPVAHCGGFLFLTLLEPR